MSKLTNLKNSMKLAAKGAARVTKAHSPEILTIGGIALLIGAGVVACVATVNLKEKRKEIEHQKLDASTEKEHAKDILNNREIMDENEVSNAMEYIEDGHKREMRKIFTKEILMYTKMYAPAVGMTALGIVSIMAGHNILKKRLAAMTAAYVTLERSYAQYRKHVIDTYGEEVDEKFRKNIVGETDISITDDDGNEIGTEKADIIDEKKDYSILYDTSPMFFHNAPERNYHMLKGLQCQANDLLHLKGSLMLNDIRDMLSLPRTSDDAVVGWSLKDIDKRHVDGYIDFGLDFDDVDMDHWVEGIWLHFNCDGFVQHIISD